MSRPSDQPVRLARPPRNDDELDLVFQAFWGIKLPRVKVCEHHVSPFEAVAHAYFSREPGYAVWYASRGSGKSLALAALGLTKSVVEDIDVTILGGSMTQSQNVRDHMRKLQAYKRAPNYAIKRSIASMIELHTGKQITPLPASQTTVRGPHPPLTLLDEVDEMDWEIYEASLGQAMEQLNVHGKMVGEYIVASSTWQNPEGTFTRVIEQAREKGQPVFTWCWRELLAEHGGWMSRRFIEQKRKTVTAAMWHTEYELNEPNAGSRAFDLDKVERYFVPYDAPVRERHRTDEDIWVWEDPAPNGLYAVGADWAKEQDKTVIAVVRYDVSPYRLVKLTRINRRPWDVMIGLYNLDMHNYRALGYHDGTGVGNVVDSFITDDDASTKFVMVGRKRTQMLLDYIISFENGHYRLPAPSSSAVVVGHTSDPLGALKRGHRATTVADVYAPGKWDSHLPDDVCAMAMVHQALTRVGAVPAPAGGVPVDSTPAKSLLPLFREPEDSWRIGEISRRDSEPDDVGLFWLPERGGSDDDNLAMSLVF